MREPAEPEIGQRGEHFALAGNGRGQDHVEGGQAIGLDDQQALVVHRVDVAHFAAMEQLQRAHGRFEQAFGHRRRSAADPGCAFWLSTLAACSGFTRS